MDKGACEGAFSLYEGLYNYVTNQGARPTSAIIMGDVAYGGGDANVTDSTRLAFQKYLNGTVPEDRVFVAIGNHDVHYLGCSKGQPTSWCYYGAAIKNGYQAKHEMSFSQWRSNWMESFPGLRKSAILPPLGNKDSKPWVAPMRYNVNLDKASSVYLIVGLNSGVGSPRWNGDTPTEATDAMLEPSVECSFLEDSLSHGRSLGKTIFIYSTHHFSMACNDWSLIRQIDIWMYGHKHNYWQSALANETIMQERQYYPSRLLIGNGGFDEGYIDVVSFSHVEEEIVSGGERVRLKFQIFDTCISDEAHCGRVPFMEACWRRCKAFEGGFDNGGGPRKATPSKHGFGFQYEAPRKRPVAKRQPEKLWSGTWKLQVTEENGTGAWLTLGTCPWSWTGGQCLRPTQDESEATSFDFFNVRDAYDILDFRLHMTAQVAVNDDTRSALMSTKGPDDKEGFPMLHRPSRGFWEAEDAGEGVHPSQGYALEFATKPGPVHDWKLLHARWISTRYKVWAGDALAISPGNSLPVAFKRCDSSKQAVVFV